MALMEVSGDGLRAVLQYLEPKDLCRCKLVCHKLGALASEVRSAILHRHMLDGFAYGVYIRAFP